MRKIPVIALVGAMLFFCLSMARAAKPGLHINGDNVVCQKTSHNYTATPAPVPGNTYVWSTNSLGTVTFSSGVNATVYWALPGTGTIKLVVLNPSGAHIDSTTFNVTVVATPNPYITTNKRVACQKLGDTVFDNKPHPPVFEDTGCLKTCAYGCAVYYANGNSTSTFTWTAAGSASITVLDPSGDSVLVCWGAPGSGSVTVTETTPEGCTGSRTLCIDVIEAPIAHIVALPDTNLRDINICDSTEVVFLDASAASSGSPIVTWRWDFGDGTFSNAVGGYLTPITHEYTTIGGMATDYWAKLTVTNACGCSTTDSIHIHVDPNVRLKIECPRVVCEGATENYSVVTGCTTGIWSVIGGTIISSTATTVQIKWNSPGADGFGYVMFDANSCGLACAFAVAKVPIVMNSGTIVGQTIVCPNSQYIYRLPQWPTTKYNWTISTGTGAFLGTTDQPNEIVLNTVNAGTVIITCNYTNTLLGCGGSANIVINVLDPESIDGPDKACFNTTIPYLTHNGSNGNWVLTKPSSATQSATGTNTFNALFDEVGIYKLEVSGTTFCTPPPMYIKVDSLPHPPDTIIGPDHFCKGVETKFLAGNDISGTIYNWGMLNGTVNAGSGKQSFIKMNIGSSGPFVIYSWRTTKEMPYCPSDTITDTVHPIVVTMAMTGPTSVCPSSYTSHSETYTTGETYEWSLSNPAMGSVASGDGTPNVQMLWNKTTGTVWLRCKMRRCLDIYWDSTLISIGMFPTPAFTSLPSPVCDLNQFTATLNTGGTSVYWNFGDGNPGFIDNASVDYTYILNNPAAVVKTVTAIITNPWGCTGKDTVTGNVTVNPTPHYTISPHGTGGVITYCDTFTVTLNAVYLFGPTATLFQWYYNGSPISGATSSSYVAHNNFGYYKVFVKNGSGGCGAFSDSIRIINQCNCTLVIPDTVTISAVQSGCNTYTFTGFHSSKGYIPGSYSWDEIIGFDSYPLSGTEFSSTDYFDYGDHKVRYCVTIADSVGDTCRRCAVMTVTSPFHQGYKVSFDCTSSGGGRGTTISGGPALPGTNYDFYIDVAPPSAPTQSGTSDVYSGYLTPGTHSVIIVQSLAGYSSCTYSNPVNVPALPSAAFNFARTTTCIKEATVHFDNVSTPSTFPPMDVDGANWDFGDGTGNNQYFTADRVYQSVPVGGVYPVTLTVTDIYGCSSSITHNVSVVDDDMIGTLDVKPGTHVCEGTAVKLDYLPTFPTSQPVPPYYDWYTDKTLIAHTTTHPINVFESGYYWLHVQDQYGCIQNTPPVTVEVVQVPDAIITGDHDACQDVSYTLNGYAGSDPNITYSWTVDGSPTGATTATYTDVYSIAGVHNYQVTVSVPDGSGGFCTKTSATFTVTVHGTPAKPTPSFNIINCATYEVQLSATAATTGTFNWSTGQSGTPVTTYAGGKYQVTFTDTYGCISRNTLYVPKDPKVYLWIFPTGCWEICTTSHYIITGPIWTFASWRYLKNGVGIFGGISVPNDYLNLNIDAPGVFNLYLDNGYCNATSGNMYVTTTGCNPQGKEGTTSIVMSHDGNNTNITSGQLQLLIAPNPANNSTRIDYTWTGEGNGRRLEVYDMTGRLIMHYNATAQKGSWQLSLESFAPGVYQVVMKQDGKSLLTSKLSIVK